MSLPCVNWSAFFPVRRGAGERLRRVWALALVGLIWAAGLLAWAPETHAHLHGPSEHACVVTWFAQGIADPVPPPITIERPVAEAAATPRLAEQWVWPTRQWRLPPGRGPPRG